MNWETYKHKLTATGNSRRDRQIAQTQRSILNRSINSPAYKEVLINGEPRQVVITSCAELYNKRINALPNEHIYAGDDVEWNGQHWIIDMIDCEDEVYQRGTMKHCNTYLKWQKEDGEIIGRWGYSEDITKFALGMVETTIINSIQFGIKLLLPLDEETVKLRRDRRFLIGIEEDKPNAYILTQRNVITQNFSQTLVNKGGILTLSFSQTQLEEQNGDRPDLMIANYFDPKELEDNFIPTENVNCKITHSGKAELKSGGSYKTFKAEYYNDKNELLEGYTPQWEVIVLPEFQEWITINLTTDGHCKIKVADKPQLVGSSLTVRVTTQELPDCVAEKNIKVVSIY